MEEILKISNNDKRLVRNQPYKPFFIYFKRVLWYNIVPLNEGHN